MCHRYFILNDKKQFQSVFPVLARTPTRSRPRPVKLHETQEPYIHRNAPDKYSYQKRKSQIQIAFSV